MKGFIKYIAVLFLATMLLAACQRNIKYPYAIRDFDAEVQPLLESLASNGIFNRNWHIQEDLRERLSENDLKNLSKCDVPILRLFAMDALLNAVQKEIDDEFERTSTQMDIAFTHLDDTASVNVDNGEFGIYRRLISDYILGNFSPNHIDPKLSDKLTLELLSNRPYLHQTYSSYTKRFSRLPNGHQLIRNIVEHKYKPVPINEPFEGGEAEEMLLRLASFQKAADTTLIRLRLQDCINDWSRHFNIRNNRWNLGRGYLLETLTKYPYPEYAVPVTMLVDMMIRENTGILEEDLYIKYSGDEIGLDDHFAAVAAIRSNHGKQQLARLLRHYQDLALNNESLYRTFGKEALSKLKTFIKAYDYADYKSLLQ
ncbi:MAG: hypothetical protein IT252_16380 [Chitinophagaceae bacterium]|nr:hypothetical protein [Chitinophagaceae bacterium]